MEQHPDKTFVGRISRGFDFLGYRISPAGLIGLARQSVQQTVERINRLYEQGVGRGCSTRVTEIRIGQYVRRWWAWVRGGMLRACRGGDCLEFPLGVLPVKLTEAMRANGVLYLSGDLPAAAQRQAAEGNGPQAEARRFGEILAGPGEAVDSAQRE
jgi:hypothetical protein